MIGLRTRQALKEFLKPDPERIKELEEKREELKRQMGRKYAHHPDNFIRRNNGTLGR